MADETIRVRPPEGTRTTVVAPEPVIRHTGDVTRVRTYEGEEITGGRDRVRWGPIIAGLLTALTAMLLLNLLGAAIGLTAVNAGAAAATGGPPPQTGPTAAIWAAISGILSFLLGGYVAGRTAGVFDRNWGALNGALVFMLAVPLVLWLASMGLGAVMGSLGAVADMRPDVAQGAAEQARSAAQAASPVDVARAAETARNTAWGALIGSLLGLGASALGGWLGTRHPYVTEEETTHHVSH